MSDETGKPEEETVEDETCEGPMRRRRRHNRHGPGRGRMGRDRDTTRVQLEMPPQSMERLQRLKDKTEATSYAEVMKTALRLYEALIEEAEAGREFAVREADGTVTPYKVFV